ncbi:molybdenum cofactor biosynthesis F family protein [Aspergillus lucknowensis]|uniref:Molybdenum cofactor biosynthesis protein F n=1 Tax=Aspergillus lucknowensis TaxID=176173 RepID=A0ABR4LFF8_9EURO
MSKDPKSNDYVPVSEWPDAESWTAGFDEYLMPRSYELANQQFMLIFENGMRIMHSFRDAKVLTWKIEESGQSGLIVDSSGTQEYKAFEVRPKVFFIDFYKEKYEENVSLVLNTITGQVICGISGFYDREGKRRTKTTFLNARMENHSNAKSFQPTDALVGKHILYRYTPRDWYEHIYLNRGTFTWHCVAGTEKGLADTEPTKVLELGEDLYMLFWTETVMPVESFIVVDLQQMRSTGRFFCWDLKAKRMVHKVFGSHANILAESTIDKVLASLSN